MAADIDWCMKTSIAYTRRGLHTSIFPYQKDAKNSAEQGTQQEAQEGESVSHKQQDTKEEGDGLSLEQLQELNGNLKSELESTRKEMEDMKEKLVRTLADMENLRDRTSRQLEEARQFAVQGLVKSLVEVADNLERAAGSVSEDSGEIDVDRALGLLNSLRDGVIMTDGILMKILEKEGVKRFDPLGEQFDPNMHNALFKVEDATKDPGTVAVVIKKGYMLLDRAVRAADVGVVKASED